MQENVAQDPWTFPVEVLTEWRGGVESRSQVLRSGESPNCFALIVDEPPNQLGSNAGPRPEELMLAAVGARFVEAFAIFATVAGSIIESLTVAARVQTNGGPPIMVELNARVVGDGDPSMLNELGDRARFAAESMLQLGSYEVRAATSITRINC